MNVAGTGKAAAGAEKLHRALAAAQADSARLRAALGIDQPWSVPAMLDNLATAALHLVKDHDCDRHGWEEVTGNIARVRVAAAKLRAALAAPIGDEALREFGLRVAVAVHENEGDGTIAGSLPELVDAVLRGDL